MKPWYKITWPAPQVRLVLKYEDVFWRWWQEQDALEAKNAAEQRRMYPDQAVTPALMVWSDDGGPEA